MYLYSKLKNLFFLKDNEDSYRAAGVLPDDCIDVDDDLFNEFSQPKAGKVRVVGADGLPKWGDAPSLTDDEVFAANIEKKAALIAEAGQVIAPLSDALAGGYIDDADKPKLTDWQKYRYALTKVDPANPVWPEKPAE
ncbi:TPA: tail assembly chaperone [Escherichia coli]|uniref:tail fiber assembly protein n=1 Tax=Escherichia coli TaxID=562 RepID=UPI0002A32BA7|nr:tail assembly chaperone [Escherichia coli]EAC1938297.1 tail assembly chaperone [Escherichia coli]EEV6103244.1 tail assembly chaperone [Escherichia coli]EEY5681619.1 tail assembly chaperone [Escherichia coli]EFA4014079.1 tail assembly chaperone [Escherichia coli]EFB2747140.1 tail assembly chaperone [Escherichia coli]